MKKILILNILFCLLIAEIFGQISISPSKAEYFKIESLDLKDCNGLYPVRISYSSQQKFDKILFLYSENSEGPFIKFDEILDTKNNQIIIHNNKSAIPGKKYYYKAQGIINDLIAEESSIQCGWGALTPEIYFMLYNKMITFSHNKLVLMNKKKTLDKLGSETIDGNLSGSLAYKTSVKGLSGVVTMDYVNYSDNSDWIIDGSMNTKANMSANGTMYGTIEIKGMYPGKIYYDNVIITDGKAGGGTYDVQPFGLDLKKLDYQITFINIDDLY